MGKRTVKQEYETTETVEETVETEVPVTKEDEATVYFCDDCGNPHERNALKKYSPDGSSGGDHVHFCDGCESRLLESKEALEGIDEVPNTMTAMVAESGLVRFLDDWRKWSVFLVIIGAWVGQVSLAAGAFWIGAGVFLFVDRRLPVVNEEAAEMFRTLERWFHTGFDWLVSLLRSGQ